MKYGFRTLIIIAVVALLVLPLAACAKKPPAPPPPPPAGTISVEPAKIDFELLKKYFPPIAKALGLPEAMSATVPHLAMLAVPVKFTGSGWRPNEIITVELVVPPDVEIPGLDRARGEDAVGIAFATADSAGNFEAKMERTAIIGFILRGGFQPTLAPDPKTLIPGNPLPNGTYTVRAVGEDPRSVATTTWVLELKPPAAPPAAAPPAAPPAAPGAVSFEAATYKNDQYGFTIKYPKDWQVAPPSKTLITAQKGGLVPAMFVGAVDGADFAEAVKNTLLLAEGSDIKVGDVSEATLADGSKGSKAPITATLRGFPAKGLAIGAKKGDKWIVCCVGTVEMLAPYDEKLFTEIGTSLNFGGAAPPAAPPTAPPAAKLPFEPATYTNDQYGFSIKYPKDWQVAPPSKTLITAQKGGLVPAMFVGAVDGADFAEAVKNTLLLAEGSDIKVGDVSEATLADGSKGSKAPITATLRGFPAKGLAVGAKKGDKWIVCCVGTVEMLAPYDEALFTAIGTSLEFKK